MTPVPGFRARNRANIRGKFRGHKGHGMASAGAKRLALVFLGAVVLSACEDGAEFSPFGKSEPGSAAATTGGGQTTSVIERDVEAPEVFQVSDQGLWDGRPSLGGVWVTHPDVQDPERVIVRNDSNGKFVVAALYKPDLNLGRPGPKFLVSSDAAEALGMLAGAPAPLNVTALRHEQVPVAPEVTAPTVDTLEQPEAIEEVNIDDPVAALAASAIEEATASSEAASESPITPAAPAATATAAPAAPAAPAQTSRLEKPYIQIGIFSVESNAENTAKLLRDAGVLPTIKTSETNNKKYWRVIVGPALTSSERTAMLNKVKGLGFGDAYAVTH